MNNEAKVRRSTKLVVLGKAKMMSYEDLEEARAKRATKEKATTRKGKRDAKRKSYARARAKGAGGFAQRSDESIGAKGQSGANEQSWASEDPRSTMEGPSGANVLG
jgi:hypothetical protein